METPDYEPQNTIRVRSTFLTVICVLTFIGSGWGVCKAVREYLQADNIAAMTSATMEQAQDKINAQGSPDFLKGMFSSISASLTPPKIREGAIINLISCLLTLGGAIMMWRLQKAGFYLYVLGTIIMVAAPLIMMGTGAIGLMGAGVTGFIGFVFIAMYGANLKDMR